MKVCGHSPWDVGLPSLVGFRGREDICGGVWWCIGCVEVCGGIGDECGGGVEVEVAGGK